MSAYIEDAAREDALRAALEERGLSSDALSPVLGATVQIFSEAFRVGWDTALGDIPRPCHKCGVETLGREHVWFCDEHSPRAESRKELAKVYSGEICVGFGGAGGTEDDVHY